MRHHIEAAAMAWLWLCRGHDKGGGRAQCGVPRAGLPVDSHAARRTPHAAPKRTMPDVPQATFLNFLSGLGSQALMQFGEIPNPLTGQRAVNPPYARYTVELLRVLQEKSAGNRTPEEDQYLTTMLEDLGARLAKLPPA
jgi:hypothetical protein